MVLLVEDDRGLRVAIGRVLRASGFVALAYASAEAALADPVAGAPDCLVLDLNLPAMSGLELLDRLRERGVDAPAVAITASDTARVREELRRRGVEHLLPKPFGGPALVGLLDRLLAEAARDGLHQRASPAAPSRDAAAGHIAHDRAPPARAPGGIPPTPTTDTQEGDP